MTSLQKTVAAYGSWKSPIVASDVAKEALRLESVRVDVTGQGKEGVVYWTELRPWEGGAIRVCSRDMSHHDGSDDHPTQWTHGDYNARTRVHEYGGSGSFIHAGVVYFSNFKDQRLYKQTAHDVEPVALSPAEGGWRFADYHSIAGKKFIVAVGENHGIVTAGKAKEPENVVLSLDVESGDQHLLVRGSDFYSSPRLSPDGKQLAWIEWKHPNMPWDDTELWIAQITDDGRALVADSRLKIAGGEGINVIQPSWSPSGDLFFISDSASSDPFWSLYRADVTGNGKHHKVLGEHGHEIGLPGWQFNYSSYAINPQNSKEIAVAFKGGLHTLNTDTGKLTTIPTDFISHSHVVYSSDGHIFTVSMGPTVFQSILRINPTTHVVQVVRPSRKPLVDAEYISVGKHIKFETSDNEVAHAIYYPAKSKEFCGPEGRKPPLIVRVHGGPTASASVSLNVEYQFYTTRGIAVVDLNYRGSTGYGRAYRDRLKKNWGLCDVEDAVHGALHLSKAGEVDGDRLAISGGSAGGYTVLAALTFKDVFKAGCSRYGVSDLGALATDTHKFESRYLDLLIGEYPKEKSVYDERSPINCVEKLSAPVIFFQGDEDKIVPPSQSELMFNALKSKGILTSYVLFPGEQHGFRKLENVVAAVEGELYFYGRVMGFTPADTFEKVPHIVNQ